MKEKIPLVLILSIGFLLRISLINWDQGHHLHPDERMLIMVADKITFFSDVNPDFFNYGSLPIYILKGVATVNDMVSPVKLAHYDGLLYLGRLLSSLVDTLTILVLYKLGSLVSKNKTLGLVAASAYMIAFFPIQNSHFFIVDTFLTVFVTLQLYLLISYTKQPSMRTVMVLAIVSAAAITTKVSAIIFMPAVGIGLLLPHIMRYWADTRVRAREPRLYVSGGETPPLRTYWLPLTLNLSLFALCYVLFAFLFMPYAFIEHARFITDIKLQTTMNSDPFIFPYTLQYVGTIPYLYYLKNIFFWGWGIPLSFISLIGLIFLIRPIRLKNPWLLVSLFYALYFIIIGKSAVKFMRYMLPLYPFFALCAGIAIDQLCNPNSAQKANHAFPEAWGKLLKGTVIVLSALSVVWTGMFFSLYAKEHTRISASRWIYTNIRPGSTIAVEHWDDRLPLGLSADKQSGMYRFIELPLYEPDTPEKWDMIEESLDRADYIILASNRLYTPLMKLTDCENLPEAKCYPITARYYTDLFAETRGYEQAAVFESRPAWGIISVDDQSADESFTVYDHPKIIIYRRKS